MIADQLPLSPSITRGSIGISCQNAEVQLADFSATPLQRIFAFSDSYRSLPYHSQQEISALLPAWFSQKAVPATTGQQRNDTMIAAAAGVKTIPIIKTDGDITAEEAERLSDAIRSSLDDRMIKPLITELAVYGLGRQLPEALHKRGYSLVRILTPQQALRLVEEKRYDKNDTILIEGTVKESREALANLLHVIPPSSLVIQGGQDETIPAGVGTRPDRARNP